MTVTPELEQTAMAVFAKTAELLGIDPHAEVSLLFVDDEYIRELNRDYRGKDCATDVLSFALNEGEEPDIVGGPEETLLGDIVISLETAVKQAEEFGHSLERELAYLTVHGMLHLLGFDHENEQDKSVMREKEELVLQALGLTRTGE
ncbi:MAG: rRNA maturation RNase YbeY [Negativicutes bacterium]|nr:rRNA maturation RNase YbeY [Negativicutes bacterium]